MSRYIGSMRSATIFKSELIKRFTANGIGVEGQAIIKGLTSTLRNRD